MSSIVIIVPYFGAFRNDFPFWIKSAESNSTIDFLLFTDQEVQVSTSNIKVIPCTLSQVELLAKEKVWDGCVLTTSYKLCDFRPAYGQIFQDYIKQYDYWGHCDLDLIFGDIRHFITEKVLDNHDRILVAGHLSIYKNNPLVNGIYKDVTKPNWKEVFSSESSFCFDEWPGTSSYWNKNLSDKLYLNDNIYDDIEPLVYSFFSINKRKKDKGRNNFMFSFLDGKLYRYCCMGEQVVREESLYVHFQKRNLLIKTTVSNSFSIIPNRIIPYIEEPITYKFLKRTIRESRLWAYGVRIRNKILLALGMNSSLFNTHNLVLFRAIE